VVINNVNVHKTGTRLITEEYLPDAAKLANVFREYGIKMIFSINFASPMEIGALKQPIPLTGR
jgi:alpha-glucuronidase